MAINDHMTGIKVVEKFIAYNFTPNANDPVYIVVHDTGNMDAGANALMHYNYFNSQNQNASAHFFVDDHSILQTVKLTDKAWHCGDGGNKYGIGNQNSIGIEMCINADGDRNKMLANTIDLVSALMIDMFIPIYDVVRHYDASRKICPGTMYDNGTWADWLKFKDDVKNALIAKSVKKVMGMYNDDDKIADYAKEAVKKMNDEGLMKGDTAGNFNPLSPVTRQDLACVMANLLKLLGK